MIFLLVVYTVAQHTQELIDKTGYKPRIFIIKILIFSHSIITNSHFTGSPSRFGYWH